MVVALAAGPVSESLLTGIVAGDRSHKKCDVLCLAWLGPSVPDSFDRRLGNCHTDCSSDWHSSS